MVSDELLMLDTDTASYLIKGNSPALDAYLRARYLWQICISAVTRAELRFGAADVEYFLIMTKTLAWDEKCADQYGEVRTALEQGGRPIGAFDALLAAHAKSLDATLVTNNTKHFGFVKGLKLDNWAQQ